MIDSHYSEGDPGAQREKGSRSQVSTPRPWLSPHAVWPILGQEVTDRTEGRNQFLKDQQVSEPDEEVGGPEKEE